jgi:hypothetical protein
VHARLLALAALPLAVAACGSTTKLPAVASLGTQSTSTTPAAPSGGAPAGPGQARGFRIAIRGGLAFSRCMRAHGVPSFPDPGSNGVTGLTSSSGIDPKSPTFQSALQACQKALPNGGRPSPQQLAQAKRSALAFSACMRAHGLKDFPDPTFSNGGIGIRIRLGSGLDPNSPAFQRARSACGGGLLKP